METLPVRASRAPLRVLVIEDDPALGRLIQLVLGQYTEAVSVVRSGRAALAELATGSFDAIASDISLPDMSGLDVIARARVLAPASGIVAITGFVDVDVAVRSMKAGADDFLGKPFDADVLWHMLNRAVDNRAGGSRRSRRRRTGCSRTRMRSRGARTGGSSTNSSSRRWRHRRARIGRRRRRTWTSTTSSC